VEPKNDADSFTFEALIPTESTKVRSEWDQVVECASSQWSKDRPHVPFARNVGGAQKRKWTPAEDQLLDAAVAQFGQESWRRIATLVHGRNSKQCRERWLGHMAPDNTKDQWSAQEDMILVERQALTGNQWAKIKTFLPGRSLISIKNRWNWLCRRDIPNHSQEFEEIAKSQTKQEEWGGFSREDSLASEEIFSTDRQKELWPVDFLF
jgi:hypothetical protein